MITVELYRCYSCGKLRTMVDIKKGNICCIGRVVPCRSITILEEIKIGWLLLLGRLKRHKSQ